MLWCTSKLHWKPQDQASYCGIISRSIAEAESGVGHMNTVFVGDFNMNPFEEGVIGAFGFHAVMSRTIAKKQKRTVKRIKYPFFYNPMWNLFGDKTGGPLGTYYRWGSNPIEYFWHIFDQVLIRPDLLERFHDGDLEIVTSDGTNSFIFHDGIPDTNNASDHLPLVFKLSL